MFWKFVIRGLTCASSGVKLQVFIFHRVLVKSDPLLGGEPDVESFEWMIRFIADTYSVLPFGDAVGRLRRGMLSSPTACITFDDGYRDNATIALPILQRYKLSATFFIATSFLDGGRMWNDDVIEALRVVQNGQLNWEEFGLGHYSIISSEDRILCKDSVLKQLKYFEHSERAQVAREISRRAGVPDTSALMMDREDVRFLRRTGMEIGAHTHSHPILSNMMDDDAELEIAQGKAELEAILGESVVSFAYPNGNTGRDLTKRDVGIVERLGFQAAAITDWGAANANTNPFLIPRFTPWDRTPIKFALRCALSLTGKGGGDVHV